MIDDETVLLLNAYFDGELSPSETIAIEKRLASEPALRAYLESLGEMSGSLKSAFSDEPVPEKRLRAIGDSIAGADAPVAAVAARPRIYAWMAMAACLVLGFGLGLWAGGPLAPWLEDRGSSVSDMVFAAHLRGLAAPEPFEIASSDRHVVKPWFNGRTTIAPKAPDLASNGFPLIGGRIDVVRDQTVPTLVYKRSRHVISVTVIPSGPDARDREEVRDGSTIMQWAAGSLTYIVVSDLNAGDLRQFVSLFKAAS